MTYLTLQSPAPRQVQRTRQAMYAERNIKGRSRNYYDIAKI
jgi:hypothetical protein